MERRKRRKVWLVVLAVLLLPVVIFPKRTYYLVNAFLDVRRAGFLDKQKQHKYTGTSMENLKALYQATMLYYEANAVMPGAEVWMDDLKPYIKTADLKRGEEVKKFVNPRIAAGVGVFGYAFNSALSGAWMENIEDPAHTALIFESNDTVWNAHGDPAELQPDPELDGGNLGVSVEGNAAKLKEMLGSDTH
jgi:hypothetical protein